MRIVNFTTLAIATVVGIAVLLGQAAIGIDRSGGVPFDDDDDDAQWAGMRSTTPFDGDRWTRSPSPVRPTPPVERSVA